jgi:hypothetical protein
VAAQLEELVAVGGAGLDHSALVTLIDPGAVRGLRRQAGAT